MLDYLVIGGGIAGLSAAAHLSALGEVLVVETEDGLGYHASGRSAALYEAEYGSPTTVALSRASGRDLVEMGVLSPRGMMIVATVQDRAVFGEDIVRMNLSEISVAEAVAKFAILNPQVVAHAAYSDSGQDIDTDLMIQTYAKALRRNGGQTRTRAPVQAIDRTAQGWKVSVAGSEVEVRVLVNAAGAWADSVARLAGIAPIGITPMRRSMAQLPAPGGHDVSHWPMVFGAGETWYAKPQSGKLLVSPAEEEPIDPHDAYADDTVLAEGLARYEAMVTEPVTRLETSWAGLRSFAPDRAMVLGPDPLDEQFIWCAGQGGQGFQASAGAARVLAQTLGGPDSGQPDTLLRAVSPARFRG